MTLTYSLAERAGSKPYYSQRHALHRVVIDLTDELPQAGGTDIEDALVLMRISGCDVIAGIGCRAELAVNNSLVPFLREVGTTTTDAGTGVNAAIGAPHAVTADTDASSYTLCRLPALDKDKEYELVIELDTADIDADNDNDTLVYAVDFLVL